MQSACVVLENKLKKSTHTVKSQGCANIHDPGLTALGRGGCPLLQVQQTAGSRQQAAGSRQQAAGSRQQAAGSGQQAAGSRQQAAGSRQQAAGSRQQAAGNGQRAPTDNAMPRTADGRRTHFTTGHGLGAGQRAAAVRVGM
jgi:hypothetical protein